MKNTRINLTRWGRHCIAVKAILLISGITACSNDTSDDGQVDSNRSPAYPTAQSLLEHLHTIGRAGNVRMADVIDLFYLENDEQRELHEYLRASIVGEQLFDEANRRFNYPVTSMGGYGELFTPADAPATIVSESPRRVVAEFTRDGSVQTLHLVEFDDSWWLSGYTLEHDPGLTDEGARAMLKMGFLLAPASKRVLERLRAGEFSTNEQFMAAQNAAIQKAMEPNPEIQALMERIQAP